MSAGVSAGVVLWVAPSVAAWVAPCRPGGAGRARWSPSSPPSPGCCWPRPRRPREGSICARLPELVYREQHQAASLARQVQGQRLANDAISRSKTVGAEAAAARRQADALATQLGLTPAAGAGLTVALDDAPRSARRAAGAPTPTPDDLVVHQQDVQGVVNALWAGGARAMTLMGQRVTATTAVRCVGNTLLLHGAVYSPPFVVAAIGDQARLRAALDAAPGVQIFRQYVAAYGLVLSVTPSSGLRLPAFTGPVELSRARPSS